MLRGLRGPIRRRRPRSPRRKRFSAEAIESGENTGLLFRRVELGSNARRSASAAVKNSYRSASSASRLRIASALRDQTPNVAALIGHERLRLDLRCPFCNWATINKRSWQNCSDQKFIPHACTTRGMLSDALTEPDEANMLRSMMILTPTHVRFLNPLAVRLAARSRTVSQAFPALPKQTMSVSKRVTRSLVVQQPSSCGSG